MGFPNTAPDCDPWVRCVLGKNATKADVLELREITAAFFGVAPQTASVKRFVEHQVWYNPKSKLRESDLNEAQRAVLARLKKIADDQRSAPGHEKAGTKGGESGAKNGRGPILGR